MKVEYNYGNMVCDCNEIRNTDEYVIAWRCWIEIDNNIIEFNSVEHCWDKIPEDGFQAMRIWYSDNTGRFVSGNDWYFIQEHPMGLIFGQSNDNDIKERYPKAIIKRGKHIPDRLMKEVNEWMVNSVKPE